MKESGETGHRVTKIKGLSLSGAIQEEMNIDLMLEFVQQFQQGKSESKVVPQPRLVIDKVSKQIRAKEVQTMYTNFSNIKRFYEPQASPTQLWPYGVTTFD